MTLGIMQPYFFPYLGYWQLINAVDEFVLLDDVNFIKQGYINKNNILGQGKPQPINFPIQNISSNKAINEHQVTSNEKWKRKLLSTIKQYYSKAINFTESYELVEACINFQESDVSKFLEFQIKEISTHLGIQTKIATSSNLHPKQELSGSDRVIDICKKSGANRYINAIGGQALYAKDEFKDNGIELSFIQTSSTLSYKQKDENFVPNLSIIDVMMFNTKEEVQELLTKYELI